MEKLASHRKKEQIERKKHPHPQIIFAGRAFFTLLYVLQAWFLERCAEHYKNRAKVCLPNRIPSQQPSQKQEKTRMPNSKGSLVFLYIGGLDEKEALVTCKLYDTRGLLTKPAQDVKKV